MNNLRYALCLLLAAFGATASCSHSESGNQLAGSPQRSPAVPAQTSSDSPVQNSPAVPASTPNRGLINSQVESAVSELLSGYRLSGSVSVRGIQELPQQNSAVADLQFNNFEYAVTFEGGLLRAKDFKPKKPSGAAIPSPDEMFPPRKISYSKDGKATLTKYTDGRWVLKQVNWGFDTGVKGSVEIR